MSVLKGDPQTGQLGPKKTLACHRTSRPGSGMALFGCVPALGPVLLRLAAPLPAVPAKAFGKLHGRLALRNVVRVPAAAPRAPPS